MDHLAAYALCSVAVAPTVRSVVEVGRARAWGWLVSMVLLWPVGVMAWMVAGRRFYADAADAPGPPPPPRPPLASRSASSR